MKKYASILCLFIWLVLASCTPQNISITPSDTPPALPTVSQSSPTPRMTGLPAVPTATPAPTEAARIPSVTPFTVSKPTQLPCWQNGGRVKQSSLRTSLLRAGLDFRVYLPPCYDQDASRRYPVLYLVHGQSYTDDQFERLGAGKIVDKLSTEGQISPFIIVMPRDRVWTQPDEDPFGQVVAEELVPYIDSQYRTVPERQYRAIGGLSRGAGWAVHLGLSKWELFGAFGAHSLPVFWTDTGHIQTWLDEIPPESYPRIFLDIGEKDRPQILASARWFEKKLADNNIPHEWYLFPGYHEEAYWAAHLEQYLRWYAAPW